MGYNIEEFVINNNIAQLSGVDISLAENKDTQQPASCKSVNEKLSELCSYVSNPEYVRVYTDSEGRFLWGIKTDGSIYWGAGVPNQVQYYVRNYISNENSNIKNVLDDFLSSNITIMKYLNDTYGYEIKNDEWLRVIIDSEYKIIAGIRLDGSVYISNLDGVDEKIQKIENKIENINDIIYFIEDKENRTQIIIDNESKIISYRKEDGTLVENAGIETSSISVEHLSISIDGMSDFQKALKENGFKSSIGDWSECQSLYIQEPRCAMINISGIEYMPTSKFVDWPAIMEFWDMSGNYFKREIIINAQGNSTLTWPKKNFAIDLVYYKKIKEDDYDSEETYYMKNETAVHCYSEIPEGTAYFDGMYEQKSFDLKIGDWIPQDSFHFKAHALDPFRGVANVGFKLYDMFEHTKSICSNRVWKRAMLPSKNLIGSNFDGMTNFSNYKLILDNDARCYPDGFPCVVYLNGDFYGIFAWNLKKHRDNYQLQKDNENHIHIDGCINASSIFSANGDITIMNWNPISDRGFEVRTPKDSYLVVTDGSKYNADVNKNQILAGLNLNESANSYNNETTYNTGDVITLDDRLYMSLIDNNIGNDPSDASYSSKPTKVWDKATDYWVEITFTNSVRQRLLKLSTFVPYLQNMSVIDTLNGQISIGNYYGEYTEVDNFSKGSWVSNENKFYMSIQNTNIGNVLNDENNWIDITSKVLEIKEFINIHFDIEGLVDYLIFVDLIVNTDGTAKNWQWTHYGSSDGYGYEDKWYVNPYDLDYAFGWSNGTYRPPTFERIGSETNIPTGWIIKFFTPELVSRYAELRNKGIIETKSIVSLLQDWIKRFGIQNYELDLEKWPLTFLTPVHIDNIYRIENWFEERIKYLDENVYNYNK